MRLQLLVVLAVLLSGSACKSAPPPEPEQVLIWQPVNTWTGNASIQTESFTSQTGTFKFTWEAQNSGAADGSLNITLHSAVSGRPLVPVAEEHGNVKDWAYVNEDPREFYVVIESKDSNWKLSVEEGISLIVTKPGKR